MSRSSSEVSSPSSSHSSIRSHSREEFSSEEGENLLPPTDHPSSSKDPTTTSNKKVAQILAVILIGVFLAASDINIVIATYALIASKFNELENASWMLNSYTLALIATQPLLGKLSDIFGRKYVLLRSYAIFVVGCLVIGMAPSLWVIVIGRVLSGIGCAGMVALVSIIITDLVPLRDVASWRSFVNVVTTTGRMLGGPLGGLLADTIGWRWSFLIQVPMMAIASALAWFIIPANIPESSTESDQQPTKDKLSRIDVAGSFTLISTTLLLLLPLELGGKQVPWSHPLIYFLLTAGVISGFLFAKAEARAKEPVLPLPLFHEPDFVLSSVVTVVQMAAQSSMMVTVPLYFQITGRGGGAAATATEAGAHLVPAVLGNTVSQLLSGALIKRYGNYKAIITLGTTCTSVGYLLMLVRWNGSTGFWESLYIVPGGFGTGAASSALFIALSASLPQPLRAIGSSSIILSSSIGSVIGISLSSAMLQATLRYGLRTTTEIDVGNRDDFVRRCLITIEFVQKLDGRPKDVVVALYVKGFRGIYTISLICSLMSTVAGLLVKNRLLS